MRRLAFLCLCLLPLALAPATSQAGQPGDGLLRPAQYYDPCQDGRVSDGKARSCKELKRWLRHRDHGWEPREGRRKRYDPCTDGSITDGRPRTCQELRRWFYDPDPQDWD